MKTISNEFFLDFNTSKKTLNLTVVLIWIQTCVSWDLRVEIFENWLTVFDRDIFRKSRLTKGAWLKKRVVAEDAKS